ncbi:SDR family oxidoreductase [Pantoea sp. Tr-811]|nr:SDR family oxidoreductase [Pantoea sp. Tr-811]NIF28595.1 SDR family oxidoreductase [Pantoea sp. Tr-811]
MNTSRTFWVTGAGHGLGLALVKRLLEQGNRVAASSKGSEAFEALTQQYGHNLLHVPWQVHEQAHAAAAAEQISQAWGALDGLIINAGSNDYLATGLAQDDLFQAIVSSNQLALEHCLDSARPLLAKGDRPQVMAVFSRYSALQLHAPTQETAGWNQAPQWLREQRGALQAEGIDLTVVAPQSPKTPVTPVLALADEWTAQSAADELVARLDAREPELVLEVLDIASLWPLPH